VISGTTKVMLRRAASRLGVHHGGRWLNRDRLLICCYHSLRELGDAGLAPPVAKREKAA